MAYQMGPDLDFSALSRLPQVYQQARAKEGLALLGRGLAEGSIDFREAAAKAAQYGDNETALKLLAMDEQRRKQAQELDASNQFTQSLSSLYGGQPGRPAAAAPSPVGPGGSVGVPNVSAPDQTSRPPVASSPTVWGDDEAVRAGIYDPPPGQRTQVAQAGPAAPPATGPSSGLPSGLSPRAMALMQAAASPRLPQNQREFAKTLLQSELDANKATPEMREWAFAKSQNPETPDFTTWVRENKAAGKTTVNVDTKGETKFEEKLSEGQAKRWNGYIAAGETAQRKLVDIDSMREISARIGSQGAQANIKEAIGPYAEALGINVDGLSDIQAYSSIVQRLAPQQRAEGSGSTSDIEFKGFLKSLPTLTQNPAARDMTLNTMEALTRDEIARGEIATKLATKEINRVEAEKQLRALPDPMRGFAEWRKANPGMYGQALKSGGAANAAPVRVRTPDEARKLPSGTKIILPDGTEGRVP